MDRVDITSAIVLSVYSVIIGESRLCGAIVAFSMRHGEDKMKTSLNWIFALSASLLLATAAVAKIWSALGSARLLAVADPIVGISFKHLMLGVGIAEISVAAVCLFRKFEQLAETLIAWMATNFLLYRIGLWWMDWHRPCACLGNLTDALHISPVLADNIMKVVLAYLLIGSYGLLFWEWRQRRKLRVESGGLLAKAEIEKA
jgi:hypothetical protein